MGSFLAVWRIFARRGLSNWRMLAVLAVGIVVASTLLASAPIYARTMADLGLTFVIHDELKDHPSTRIEMRDQPLDTQDSRATRDAIEKRIDERVGWFESARERYLRAPWMPLAKANQALGSGSPFGQLQSLTGYETHVKVIDGRLPAARGSGQPIEVAMGTGAFRRSGLKVGEQFTLSDDFDNCERTLPPPDVVPPPFPCKAQVIVRVGTPVVLVGLIEPSDVNDQFWVNTAGSYFDSTNPFADGGPVLPLFTTETALLRDFGAAHPAYPVLLAYHVFADPTRLTRTNFERARDDIHALYKDVEPLGGVAYSPLTTTLDSFGKTAKYEQVPLTILLLEIAGVALFYVVLMSAVLVERQATEIALLRSRGATTTQLVALSLTEGLVVGIPVLVAAPFLAAAATALLGVTPVFEDVSGGDLLPVTIPLLSFGMAAIGVALSLLALAGPAFLVARRSAVTQRRAEGRPGISLIQRYYLDVAMVGLAGLLLWELRERGSVFTPSAAGGVSSDPLLLASPALIILAAAAILLRLYPLVLRLAARSVAPAAGATLAVGLWQVVRSPGQYTRLTLLLMMAVAVGTFAASYSSTADRSFRDRAYYAAGVDWRAAALTGANMGDDGRAADAALHALAGVDDATSVYRAHATIAVPGVPGQGLQLLALDPAVAAGYLWFRDDFATSSLSALMGTLGPPGQFGGKVLPGDPVTLSLWVNTPEPRDQITLWARVRDSKNQYDLLELGTLAQTGWRQVSAPVHRPLGPGLVAPISLQGLVMTQPSNRFITAKSPIYFDDITVTDQANQVSVIENFENASRWAPLPSRAVQQDIFEATTDLPHSGRGSGKMTLRGGASGEQQGIYLQDERIPIPALVSDSFLAGTGLHRGDSIRIQVGEVVVPIVISGSFRLFPTLSTIDGAAIVLNRDHLMSWLNIAVSSNIPDLNEAWFKLAPGADKEALTAAVRGSNFGLVTITDRTEQLKSIEQNPLIAAGGSGILLVAFVAILVLVAMALLVSLWVGVQRRRVEFAVLRALGLSRAQVFRLLAFEYAIVAVVGLAAGAYLGLQVGRRMLSFLDVTESGARVEPGFILQTEWGVVIAGAAALVAVFVVALVLATRLLSRTSDAQALRLE